MHMKTMLIINGNFASHSFCEKGNNYFLRKLIVSMFLYIKYGSSFYKLGESIMCLECTQKSLVYGNYAANNFCLRT